MKLPGIGIGTIFTKGDSNPIAQAPVNTSAPTIYPDGNQLVGTLFTSGNGSWFATRPLTYEYRWTRNGTPIVGATSQTYTSVSADEGQTLRCEVKATNAFGSSAYIPSSNSATGVTIPVNTVAPVISGSTTLGSVLSTTDGTWTGTSPIIYAYQWKRGGVSIGGATASTYTLVAADSSANITCEVTATNVAGSASATSNTITASNFNPVNTVAPTLSPSGTQATGTVITLGNGTWTGATPITYEYRWLRDNVVITGQTNNTYTIVAGDDGKIIKGQVRATNALSTSAYVTTSNQVDATNVTNTARTQAFLTATGITDQTIIDALNAMDTSLISAGLLPSGTGAGKIKALYPIVGGTATTHKFNFVDPQDTNAAYRFTFNGGWTHSATGIKGNATNANANSYFQMTSSFQNNVHWYVYQRFAGGNSSPSIVSIPNSGDINLYTSFGTDIYARLNGSGGPHGTSATPIKGFFASRLNNTQILVGKDGTYSTYSQSSSVPSNQEIYLGGNGTIGWSDNEFAFFTLGEGLTNSEGISLNSACVTFQTSLGRNV